MWPPAVIMRGPLTNNPLEMAFVQGKQEIQTFATKAPAQSLAHRIRLRCSHRRPQNSYPQVRETLVDFRSEDAIPIVNEEAVGMIARQGFPELLQRPLRRGMRRDVVVKNPAGSNLHDDKDVEGAESSGDHHEKVAGHYDLGMVADEGQPALLRVRCAHRSVLAKILADGARGDPKAQLEHQLVGDPFLSPGGILRGHTPDESTQVFGQARSAGRP